MSKRAKLILKTKKDEAVKRFHPWVFSGAIKKMDGEPLDGELVDVYNNKEDYLATGHYQNGTIAVRLLSWNHEFDADNFWIEKIQEAYNSRLSTGIANHENLDVYRLVFAEGDGMPGLIIDHYNGNLVIQCHSVGMHKDIEKIKNALIEVYGDKLKTVYDKSSTTIHVQGELYETENKHLHGDAEFDMVNEYGAKFRIDWIRGQKTGFFIDQRENRALLAQLSRGKKVLNTFCYSGGFSISALNGGAELVHSVDSSGKAIDLCRENLELNNYDPEIHKCFVSDTMDYIQKMEEKYDVIILDPPAYAKHMSVRHKAVQGYKRLNAVALEKIKPGGLLFTFSCSQVVDRKLFENTIQAAAIQTGRKVKVLHRLSQPADHPVSIYHPEGEYLKGLVLEVL